MTASVLLVSLHRVAALRQCLASLAVQTTPPLEILVVWQGEDTVTRDAAGAMQAGVPGLRVLHCPVKGIVPAENLALQQASGEVVLLIDDDAVAPPDWIERHLRFYADPGVGAVGGPADNLSPGGEPFPRRSQEPVGRLRWYGAIAGNMYDQDPQWRQRPSREVHHLVGYNFSFRRSLIPQFEARLRPYWQLFELDACLRIRAAGRRVIFDFGNVVRHTPTNTAYAGGREGDSELKIYNAAFNHAFVLAKHSPATLRAIRLLYLLTWGSRATPGLAGMLANVWTHGNWRREQVIWRNTVGSVWAGWKQGTAAR